MWKVPLIIIKTSTYTLPSSHFTIYSCMCILMIDVFINYKLYVVVLNVIGYANQSVLETYVPWIRDVEQGNNGSKLAFRLQKWF